MDLYAGAFSDRAESEKTRAMKKEVRACWGGGGGGGGGGATVRDLGASLFSFCPIGDCLIERQR